MYRMHWYYIVGPLLLILPFATYFLGVANYQNQVSQYLIYKNQEDERSTQKVEIGRLSLDLTALQEKLQLIGDKSKIDSQNNFELTTFLETAFADLNRMIVELQILKGQFKQEKKQEWHKQGSNLLRGAEWRKDFALPWASTTINVLNSSWEGKGIYEFGVYNGQSMIVIANYLLSHGLKTIPIYGFDSFVGLPYDDDKKYNCRDWNEGNFNALVATGSTSLDSTVTAVANIISKNTKYPKEEIILIPGFFSTSLNPWLKRKYNLMPAAYIDIDTDVYIGAYQALDYMFANNLVSVGTVIGFDDWCGSKAWANYEAGESKALHEIMLKYRVKFSVVPKRPTYIVILRVEALNVDDYSTGFEKANYKPCGR